MQNYYIVHTILIVQQTIFLSKFLTKEAGLLNYDPFRTAKRKWLTSAHLMSLPCEIVPYRVQATRAVHPLSLGFNVLLLRRVVSFKLAIHFDDDTHLMIQTISQANKHYKIVTGPNSSKIQTS